MKYHSKQKSKHPVKIMLAVVIAMIVGILCVAYSAQTLTARAGALDFESNFNTLLEVQDYGDALNEKIGEEGMSLLYNDGLLPIDTSAGNKVSVFGIYSYSLLLGGTGSGGGNVGYGTRRTAINIPESLVSAGFDVNPSLATAFYPNWPTIPTSALTQTEKAMSVYEGYENSYTEYNDVAVYTISRVGGEFNDAPVYNISGYDSLLDHRYTLNTFDKQMINYLGQKFGNGNVVLLLNSGHPVELGWAADNPAIGAIIDVGTPGKTGASSVGAILSGAVNPSGRTVDAFPAKFSKDPTWENFMFNAQGHVFEYTIAADAISEGVPAAATTVLAVTELNGDISFTYSSVNYKIAAGTSVITTGGTAIPGASGSTAAQLRFTKFYDKDGNDVVAQGPNGGAQQYNALDYEEGIYNGYRYYETAAEMGFFDEMATADGVDLDDYMPADTSVTDTYYNRYNGIVFPFGHGLSYTDFKWTIDNTDRDISGKDADIEIEVTVTNIGDYAGKDVIQVYSNPPYYTDGIEKASANMVDFAKTKLLQPGERQTLKISFPTKYLASFDHDDTNGNGFAGYELEAGDYYISLRTNSHEIKPGCETKYTVADKGAVGEFESTAVSGKNGLYFLTDEETGATIRPLFTGDGNWDGTRNDNDYYETRHTDFISEEGWTEFKRSDMLATFPKAPTTENLRLTDDALMILDSQIYTSSFNDLPTDPWYKSKADIPANWTQESESSSSSRRAPIQLSEMAGVPYDSDKWDTFMNQLKWTELTGLMGRSGGGAGSYRTAACTPIGKLQTVDQDGPNQLKYSSTNTYANFSAFFAGHPIIAGTYNVELAEAQGRNIGDTGMFNNTSGWYAPGLNIHRTPMAGRNFEYYGQDGLQSGMIAAAVIGGATSKGMVVYMKHLMMNDQESNRYTASTFATEQAMREIYAKPFELAIKHGGANASMTAFNRIGLQHASNYNLYTRLLENEFGFKAASVTDMYGWSYNPGQNAALAIRGGNTFALGTWTASFGRNIDGDWDATKNTVVSTFANVTNGTNWIDQSTSGTAFNVTAISPNVVNRGASASYIGQKTMKDTGTGELHTVGSAAVGTEGEDGYEAAVPASTIDSYTQWYVVRNAAQHMLYAQANSIGNRAGIISNPLLAGQNGAGTSTSNRISLGTYQAGDKVAVDLLSTTSFRDNTTDVSGRKLTFEITTGTLPDGLTLNQYTGQIYGTIGSAVTAGTTNLAIRITADGWIGSSLRGNYIAYYSLVVASAPTPAQQWLTGTAAPAASLGNVGDMYFDTVSGDVYQKALIEEVATWSKIGSINDGIFDDDDLWDAIGALEDEINNIKTIIADIDDIKADIASIQADIGGLATATALAGLVDRVTALEADTGDLAALYTYIDGLIAGLEDEIENIALTPGPDGKSAYDLAVAGGYSGTVTEWLASLKGTTGEKGDTGATGAAGKGIVSIAKTGSVGLVDTYTITYTDNSVSTFDVNNGATGATGLTGAAGATGATGAAGAAGTSSVVTIGTNGNWYINDIDSGVKAVGTDGTNGTTPTIVIGTNGNWYINGTDTAISATGPAGADGSGCNSAIGGGIGAMFGIIALAGAAVIVLKKRKDTSK